MSVAEQPTYVIELGFLRSYRHRTVGRFVAKGVKQRTNFRRGNGFADPDILLSGFFMN